MRAVWIGVPESFLEERHRLDQDKKDELWEGVLHMVPPPASIHSMVQTDLIVALAAIAKRRGLNVRTEYGVFQHAKNYRVPDVTLVRTEQESGRGGEGAELVIEVLSPDDESREKLPFYARVGVREVWLIEPASRAFEIFTLRGHEYQPVPVFDRSARSPVLGIELRVAEGTLELRDGDDLHVI